MGHNGLLRIGDVAVLMGTPPHTIRYWEREFGEFLRPHRSESKQRRYAPDQVRLLRAIKRMLKEEKYTIAGAKQRLRETHGKDIRSRGSPPIDPAGHGEEEMNLEQRRPASLGA